MQKDKWMNHAYIVKDKKQSGYILYEQLFTLLIIACILPFIFYIIMLLEQITVNDDIAVEHFFVFIRQDIWNANHYRTDNNRLFVMNDSGDESIIELRTKRIRRSLNGGNEFYLFGVNDFKVEKLDYGLYLSITTERGNKYEKIIHALPQ